MWRSLAARSRQFRRTLYASRYKKVEALVPYQSSRLLFGPALRRHPRFFSHSSVTPTQELGDNGETKINSFAPAIDIHGELDQSHAVFDGNGDIGDERSDFVGLGRIGEEGESQVESSAFADVENDTPELFSQNSFEEKGGEIDREKLDAVLPLLQRRVDGSLDSILDGLDLDLHPDFVITVLETPRLLDETLIKFIKWAMGKPGFRITTRVIEAFVLAVCSGDTRRKDTYVLWDLIKEIGVKENLVLNADVLNVLIACFSKLGKGKAALEVFNQFGDLGCAPNAETYYLTIEALVRRSFVDWAWSVCNKMIDAGILPQNEQVGNIISWFCKEGKDKEAHLVFELAKKGKSKYPPQSSVDALVNSLSKKDDTVDLALDVLADFSPEARKLAIKPFSSVIRALCRINNASEAKALLLNMVSYGPPPGNAVFNSIINVYSKGGDMNEAKELMKLMERRGLKPDVYTYTVVISGYAKGGQMEEACGIISEAKTKHSKLSPATYHSLIRGYCKLEQYDEALKLFGEMKDSGVQPNADEYSKLIQSLCLKALDWERAEKLLQEMRDKGLQLNGITRGLIRAVKELDLHLVGNETLTAEA